MIPQAALLLWVLISVSLFATLSPLRAFLLTYVVGLLFLPVEITDVNGYHIGSIVLTQSLRLDKYAACNVGAILGTVMFAPQVFRHYRWQWLDLAFVLVIVGQFLTSMQNDLGARDGISAGVQLMRDYLPILVLSRLYITSMKDIVEACRMMIGGALVYAGLCMFEWRFSPQVHRYVYGYFQHSFDGFMRNDHFRSVGFFRHAIELSVFMATASVMAGWLWARGLMRPLWGLIPNWLLLPILLVGLATTISFSGYGALVLCATILALVFFMRSRWLLLVLPVLAIAWMAGRYTGAISTEDLVSLTQRWNPSHANSFKYRLDAEDLNFAALRDHFWLGQGAYHGAARTEEGRFTLFLDSQWLINLVFFGFVGLGSWFLLWAASIYETVMRWRKLDPQAQAIAALVCVLLGAQFIDFLFNDFPSKFLLIMDVGLISALQHYKPVRVVRRVWVPAQVTPPAGEVAVR